MPYLTKTFLTLALLGAFVHVGASPLFDEDTVLDVELIGPLGAIIEEVNDRKQLPFILRANGIEHAIKVRVRGKSRTKVCGFPPLRINFAADDTAQSVFAGQDKLKLVTHCEANTSAQTNTLEEYAAYRIFNLISDVSYRVRLMRITYVDTDRQRKDNAIERYGFLIESAAELADRLDGERVHVTGVSLSSLDSQHAAATFIFQYLVGNTDWSLVRAEADDTCCHNGDLFDIGALRYYVPYDFDLSGLVNAHYARPDRSVRIKKVTQRRYRGYCLPGEVLKDALSAILSRRAEILDVIRHLPGLSQKTIAARVRYLDKFFVQANDEGKLLRSFERRCL